MDINPQTMQVISTSFQTRFRTAYESMKVQTSYERLATVIPSRADREAYFLDGDVPELTEWVGERTITELAEYDWTIKNRKFQAGIKVKRDHVEDDQLGIFADKSAQLGESAARHPDKLVIDLIEKGDSTYCYDGQYFFDADHETGKSGRWGNVGSAPLTMDAAGVAAIQAALIAGAEVRTDQGVKMNIRYNLLIVPQALELTARALATMNPIYAPGAVPGTFVPIPNPLVGTFSVLVVPTLNSAVNWYMVDASKPMKPFIFQMRRAVALKSMTGPMDESVFWREEFLWVVDYRGNAGFGLPQLAYGSFPREEGPQ